MSLMLLSSLLFLTSATTVLFITLFFGEKKKQKHLQKILATEYSAMAEPLEKVAFGMLAQEMKTSVRSKTWYAPFIEGLAPIRNNFNKITSEPVQRLCYVGTDAWMEGIACARKIGTELGGKGSVAVIVTSTLKALIMAQRHRSFITTITNEFPLIQIFATYEALANQENARSFVVQNASSINALYVTGNSAVPGVAQGIEDACKTGRIYVVCHDLDEKIVQNIRRGSISASLICSTYAQGRDPVIHLFNHLTTNWKPFQPRLIIDLTTVTSATVSDYWDDTTKQPKKTGPLHDTGVTPPILSSKPIRILVFCEDWNNAFKQMKEGIQVASDMLRNKNATVIIHTLNQLKRNPIEVLCEAERIIENEKKNGLHAIATFVGMAEMIPLLNKIEKQGIKIATFNSEPLGLRSMILWLVHGSMQLSRFTDEYKSGHSEIDTALKDILFSINSMVGRIAEGARSVIEGAKSVETLTTLIEHTSDSEVLQNKRITQSSELTAKLSSMVDFFSSRVDGLKAMGVQVQKASEKSLTMEKYSDKIQSIIEIIEGIAAQTNLLAFNAAVEASHAGEWGKGFTVISQEIRALANKSVQSTNDIALLIKNIRSAIREGIEANAESKKIVEEQVSSITSATHQLSSIAEELISSMRIVQQTVIENSRIIQEMKSSAQTVNTVMAESTAVSMDNSGTIETISSTFTEISAQFSEMNKQTTQLSELVTILEGTVASFSS